MKVTVTMNDGATRTLTEVDEIYTNYGNILKPSERNKPFPFKKYTFSYFYHEELLVFKSLHHEVSIRKIDIVDMKIEREVEPNA